MFRTFHRPLVGLVFLLGLISGCASDRPLTAPETGVSGNFVPLTTPIIAVGDTQEHESTGFPLHDNDSSLDSYIEVAQRPPEQTLFGRRLLEWVLSAHPKEPFIHLGDAMDLSCRSEAERIGRIFKSSEAPGVILPGNHDGLMFGIYAYNLYDIIQDTDARKWNRLCKRGKHEEDGAFRTDREALSKSDYISTYIENVASSLHPQPGPTIEPEGRKRTMSWRSPDSEAFLLAVAGELLEGYGYADSFIVQRIRAPRAPEATRNTIIIGLDTNQAGPFVSAWDTLMGRSPGDKGHIHPDQIEIVRKWIDQAISDEDIVIFAGHHNWNSLGLPTRVMLRRQMKRLGHPLVYLSAHTHTGFWTTHRAFNGPPILELNVSSLSDWPLAYRRVSFDYDEVARRIRVRGELLPANGMPVTTDAELLEAWNAQTCARTGLTTEHIRNQDLELVRLQRESRGTALEWLESWLAPVCPTCEEPLYRHAISYQAELLKALLEVDQDMELVVHQLHTLELPQWCEDPDYVACSNKLLAERPTNFKESTQIFRRKAMMVDLLNDHLDNLGSPLVKRYMTCRAVHAAKIDYDLMNADNDTDGPEAQRRRNNFFRTEASVGMN